MVFRTPSYYNTFRCSADKCTDNCCIGWEIDIDSATAEFYASVGGAFGQRLKENISPENSFILKGERCPFLNDRNLCDIIINCGENRLCQICSDHPRYFEWYGNIKEGGIGLCCEEATKLILTSDDMKTEEREISEPSEDVDCELFSYLFSARERIFEILNDNTLTLSHRLCAVLDFAEQLQFAIDNPHLSGEYAPEVIAPEKGSIKDIVKLFSDFEPIDESWTKELSSLQTKIIDDGSVLRLNSDTEEKYLLNLIRYFIWRYFLKGTFDGEILSKVKFALVSLLFIKAMCGGGNDLDTWIEKSKLYSKQMEYSEENKELFFDYTYEKDCLFTAKLKGLLKSLTPES